MSKTSWLDATTLPKELTAGEEDFNSLWDLCPRERHVIRSYGKLTPTPRFQQAYLRTYKFSGTESIALPLPPLFAPYLTWANNLGYGDFNAVLINWYADGTQYIVAHSDDERQLVKNSPVVTITICQPSETEKKGFIAKPVLRKFRIRNKEDKAIVKDIETGNGSVLIMGGRFQKKFTHEIVKITGAGANLVGPRISVTLRQFAEEEEEAGETKQQGDKDMCALCLSRALYMEEGAHGLNFCGADCQAAFHEVLIHNV